MIFNKKKNGIISITKGYDILLSGEAGKSLTRLSSEKYHVLPSDFRWLTPHLLVEEGQDVTIGTPLFSDKNEERIIIVSPVNGKIESIIRGEKRVIEEIVIEADDSQQTGQKEIPSFTGKKELTDILLHNGLWPFIRQRPFSTIAHPDDTPKAIYVSCFDSAPLAPDYNILLENREEEFIKGIDIIKQLAPVTLCTKAGKDNSLFDQIPDVKKQTFSGPHPAGNVGTQIHKTSPINKGETVWHIHPQDIATIGRFFLSGKLDFSKTVALTGPSVKNGGYWKMTYGADIGTLFQGNLNTDAPVRKISGNILTGKKLDKIESVRFYDNQITVIQEGGQREFLGWLLPGLKKWSFSHTFLAFLTPNKKFSFSTSLHGGHRNFVMTDIYEKVFPFDILPLQLLKACIIGDIEQMEDLGIYEVDDEDFALCEVVCPAKSECQKIIRDGLLKVKNS